MYKKFLILLLPALCLASSDNTAFAAQPKKKKNRLPLKKKKVSSREHMPCSLCKKHCHDKDIAPGQTLRIHKTCLQCIMCGKQYTKKIPDRDIVRCLICSRCARENYDKKIKKFLCTLCKAPLISFMKIAHLREPLERESTLLLCKQCYKISAKCPQCKKIAKKPYHTLRSRKKIFKICKACPTLCQSCNNNVFEVDGIPEVTQSVYGTFKFYCYACICSDDDTSSTKARKGSRELQ